MNEHQSYFTGLTRFSILTTFAMVLAIITAGAREVPVAAVQRVIGIVEIPPIFGIPNPQGPPGSRLPSVLTPVSLYHRPKAGSGTVATVNTRDEIATAEYTYEEPGALVYRQEGGWYLIGLHGPSETAKAWLRPADAGRFHSLSELLKRGSSYFTSAWDNKLWSEPASGQATLVDTAAKDINVLSTRKIGDQTWLQVEVLLPGRCEGPEPRTVARGWAPAFSPEGKMNAWFYARGC